MATFNGSFGGGVVGSTTAAAATAYYVKIDPYIRTTTYTPAYTALVKFNATNGNTVNNFTVMRPLATAVTATAAATTSSNTVTLSADPGPSGNGVAANDILVTQNSDGTFTQYKVGAWNATSKVVTVTASTLSVNIAAGAKVWDFGINTDTDPVTNAAFPVVPGVAANTTADAFTALTSGFRTARPSEPLLIYCPNATAQTVVNYTEYCYSTV